MLTSFHICNDARDMPFVRVVLVLSRTKDKGEGSRLYKQSVALARQTHAREHTNE